MWGIKTFLVLQLRDCWRNQVSVIILGWEISKKCVKNAVFSNSSKKQTFLDFSQPRSVTDTWFLQQSLSWSIRKVLTPHMPIFWKIYFLTFIMGAWKFQSQFPLGKLYGNDPKFLPQAQIIKRNKLCPKWLFNFDIFVPP